MKCIYVLHRERCHWVSNKINLFVDLLTTDISASTLDVRQGSIAKEVKRGFSIRLFDHGISGNEKRLVASTKAKCTAHVWGDGHKLNSTGVDTHYEDFCRGLHTHYRILY